MNIIGKCVVAGNVRRTAEIAFGSPYSDEYISLKDYTVNPHRAPYSWTSNNSVFAELGRLCLMLITATCLASNLCTQGMDYGPVAQKVLLNGEPGFAWLDNMKAYGRMCESPNHKDHRAKGGNPCLEQTLESYEICCLVETFPDKHDTVEDFLRTLELAVLYAKSVTLGSTHWPQTNNVMLRNRRIGTSLSGVAQFISSRGNPKATH
jgi:ribonucleoside-triphosphate reductase (thioredoxin)